MWWTHLSQLHQHVWSSLAAHAIFILPLARRNQTWTHCNIQYNVTTATSVISSAYFSGTSPGQAWSYKGLPQENLLGLLEQHFLVIRPSCHRNNIIKKHQMIKNHYLHLYKIKQNQLNKSKENVLCQLKHKRISFMPSIAIFEKSDIKCVKWDF